MLVHSALPQNDLRGPGVQPEGNFSLAPKKSADVAVLVVDDEPLIRWSLAEMLSAQGYLVLEAGDGKGAMAVLRNPPETVDVIMLDYRLPDSNGLQLLTAIRGLSPHSRVVMMTAYGSPDVVAEALKLGAVCVVNKPIEMDDVAELVLRARATGTH